MTNRKQTVFAHLVVDDAAAALEFYKSALGATEAMRMPAKDGKRLLHAQIEVNGERILLQDDFPEFREGHSGVHALPPKLLKGTSARVHLIVPNCDEAVKRAEAAGAKIDFAAHGRLLGRSLCASTRSLRPHMELRASA